MDDCEVLDTKLQCNNRNTDDDKVSSSEGMDVAKDNESCSQIVESNLAMATKLVPSLVLVHTEPPSEASVAGMDPLFNAARKAYHLDAVIVK